jgi:electron transfer flavoprotein alpha subunit
MASLVIAEHDNASLKGATLNTVTAAVACGGDVHVLVAGAQRRRRRAGRRADRRRAKVLHADGAAAWPTAWPRTSPPRCWPCRPNYSHILFPATAGGKNVAPRVAAKLDVAQISDITKVVSADTFERPIYAGNAIATVQSADAVKVITVRTTGFDPRRPPAAAPRWKAGGRGRQRQEQLRGQRDRQERPPRTDRRQDHRQRRPGPGQRARSSTRC